VVVVVVVAAVVIVVVVFVWVRDSWRHHSCVCRVTVTWCL